MGNCFSDPSSSSKSKGQKLGSAPPKPAQQQQQQQQQPNYNTNTTSSRVAQPPRILGGGLSPGLEEGEGDARARALAAAEERARAAKGRGVNASNPKAGQLTRELEADRKAATSPRQDERMMDRGDWN